MHGRKIAVLLALAGTAGINSNASMGYLASIGPAALRYQEPVRIVRPPKAEPPPVVEPVTNVVAAVAVEPTPEPMKVSVPPEPVIGPTIAESIGEFVSGRRPDSEYAPPSVLLRYFTGASTNGVGSVLVPVGFQAPVESPAPFRSSSSYQKGP